MKRTARICIILLLVLLLAGCTGGNRTEQPEATAAAESVQETAAPETPTPQPAEEEPAAEAAEEATEPEPTEIPEIQGDPTFEGLETEDEVTVDLGETQDVGGL